MEYFYDLRCFPFINLSDQPEHTFRTTEGLLIVLQ